MLPANRRAWTRALRSGEFKQGRTGFLRVRDCYCVNGVLCELYARETGHAAEFTHFNGIYAYRGAISTLPLAVQVWCREYADNPHVKWDDGGGRVESHPLARLNDHGPGWGRSPLTFPELARLIDDQF